MLRMVSDEQVRRLLKLRKREKTLATAAAKAGMDEKTARKWLGSEKLPSQRKIERCWRTRADLFREVWSEIEGILEHIGVCFLRLMDLGSKERVKTGYFGAG